MPALPGCVPQRLGGEQSADEVIHELRRENLELSRSVAQLEQRIERRLAQIDQMQQSGSSEGVGVDGVVSADLPRFVTLDLGRYSGPVDTDDDGREETIRLYLKPLDQQGRFLPVAGRLEVVAVRIDVSGSSSIVARAALSPAQLDAAYRSTFMGTHYRVDLPLPADLSPGAHELTIKIVITDAATGAAVSRQAPMVVRVGAGGA